MPSNNNNQVNIRDLTAQAIIEQFRDDLQLPVCDDQAAIEDSIKKQYRKYHNMEIKGSPSERERAKTWFRNTSALKNQTKRAGYLDTVYQFFAHYADGIILVHIDNGQKSFDKALEDNFRAYLINSCRVDKSLENLWLKRYMTERKIGFGGKLPSKIPSPIENFKAVSGEACVTLTWDKVKENCEKIEIIREEQAQSGKGASSRAKTTIPVGAKSCRHEDKERIPGKEFKYTIYSILNGEHGAASTAYAVFIGDVKKAIGKYDKGSVLLSWTPPGDSAVVKIYRSNKAFKSNDKATPVFKGSEDVFYPADKSSFKDDKILPGSDYYYLIVVDYGNKIISNGIQLKISIPKPKEVTQAFCSYEKNSVSLSWTSPGDNGVIKIYRSNKAFKSNDTAAPVFSGSEEIFYPADKSSFRDVNITEGKSYYYLIIVDYGSKIISNGVQLKIDIPKPPDAVKSLSAQYNFSADKDVVTLNWDKLPGIQTIFYAVVRNQGKIAPLSVNDGEVIYQGKLDKYQDRQVLSGCRYSYSVFACKGEMYSRIPASAGPIDIISEVTDLKAVSADGTIELAWTTPKNVTGIIVRRSTQYFPDNYNDGAGVRALNLSNAKDENLSNGQQYFYRIICVYRPDESTEVYSDGVTISATPDQEPELLDSYLLKVKDGAVVMSWKAPSYSNAVIIKTRIAFQNTAGDLWEINDLSQFNDRIPVTGNNQAVDLTPDIEIPYYSLISMAGQYARYCGTLVGTFVPDVKDLELSRSRDGVILRWTWPKDCNAVQILKKYDDYPGDITDETSTKILVSRNDYIDYGDKYLDSIKHSTGHIYYRIFTQVHSKNEILFSAGTSLGCYHDIHITPWMYLKYHFVFSNKQTNFKGKLKLHWSLKNKLENFAGFCLVANRSEVPSSPEDGVELFRWTPQDGGLMSENEAIIDLDNIRRERWPHFLYKVFLLDSSQSRHVIIVHPNYTVSISDKGNISIEKLKSLKRHYTGKIPKTIICPECFQEFPLSQMLYTSEVTGEIKALKYNFLDKLRRKRPKAPLDSEGRTMLQKLCPGQRHELPYTAGTQDNLIIGLVGASASGKSHYICSLINRFEKQTGMDFNVAIVPVTAGTQARYKKEFYDPLFMNKSELEKTLGEKLPLIYNLTFSGELWGERRPRSITLALYDTAGDHFNDPNTVAQMVKYLGKASGVVFLVDPLQSEPIYETLPEEIKKKIVSSQVPPNYIFSNVLRVMEAESDGNLERIPVAVTLSKCDVLEDLQYFNSNSLWSSDSRHIGFYDRELHDDMTALITECMRKWCPEAYQTVERNFPRHAFFGVSATGCCSNASNKYKYVSPHRVEEPFLWILSELGVIPSR